MAKPFRPQRTIYSKKFTYDYWMESTGIPIHTGFFVDDLRTVELGWWDERQCMSAFIQLKDSEGVTSTRITEISAAETTRPLKFALDEVVYVISGRGITTIWYDGSNSKKSFEWQPHSMFLLPHGCHHQFSNMQGDAPVRLMHYSYLPMAMTAIPYPEFFFDNPCQMPDVMADLDGFCSEAKLMQQPPEGNVRRMPGYWYGNFFSDMNAWEKLDNRATRGAGGKSVYILFPDCEIFAHMSVFPPRTYKKAHRHGPGRAIIIPAGEGYSIMWEEGKEKIVVPWRECSFFVPPNRWFHQHFNSGVANARYLALHPPIQFFGKGEKIEDRAKDEIEYTDEDPFIRKKFEEELGKRGLKSLMPDEAYTNSSYEWSAKGGKQ